MSAKNPGLAREANFDGLVGPTHHYAGLSVGNVASTSHAHQVSNPKAAALQGLKKAAFLRDLGLLQGVLPPLRRPSFGALRRLGFGGTDAQVLDRAFHAAPQILSACYSSSAMWTANAATVSPSCDSADGRVHLTPANLTAKFHRSIEWPSTAAHLKQIFKGPRFAHHDPVPGYFGDEGAANHGRLTGAHGEKGTQVFVFGRSAMNEAAFAKPARYPARQTVEASHAVASLHELDFSRVRIVQQNPAAIDAGVFHNDVISVMNENVFFTHESAFVDQAKFFSELTSSWTGSRPLEIVTVLEREVPMSDVVSSYLFNSQLVSTSGGMALVCPEECRENARVWAAIEKMLASGGAIRAVHPFDLKQSMQNGGGPACLRLRVVLTDAEVSDVHSGVWLSSELERRLVAWVEKHYRDRLEISDLRDVAFAQEVSRAFDELEQILGMKIHG